jgi:hypothetical protein
MYLRAAGRLAHANTPALSQSALDSI